MNTQNLSNEAKNPTWGNDAVIDRFCILVENSRLPKIVFKFIPKPLLIYYQAVFSCLKDRSWFVKDDLFMCGRGETLQKIFRSLPVVQQAAPARRDSGRGGILLILLIVLLLLHSIACYCTILSRTML